jgi:hypothetical protein
MDVFLFLDAVCRLGFWFDLLTANVTAQALECQCQTANFVAFCGFERIFLPEMTNS